MSSAQVALPYTPTAKQMEAAWACQQSGTRVVSLDGAYRSAKTQAGGRIVAEWAMTRPAVYLIGRATYRSLKDSTQRAMLYGDGALPPLIPPEVVLGYRVSDEAVTLKNGAEILFRSLEVENTEKLRGLTLAGALVDQIEEIDEGPDGERLYDTLLGRLSDPRGERKLIAISNPGPLTHWVYRRLVNPETRDRGVRHVHFRLSDNAPNLPADYVAEMEATKETRPYWHKSFVEGVWGAFAGMAYTEFDPEIHVVPWFRPPETWLRFESMDHGAASPTAWLLWCRDHDGNLYVADEYYQEGRTVSQHAPIILERRKSWWQSDRCYGDPSVWANHGLAGQFGEPASVGTEYAKCGIQLSRANNDRAAGYMRLLELIRVEPGRLAPPWARVPARAGGSPRLFIADRCVRLIEQLQSAAVAETGMSAGQCVDPQQESTHLHAHAAARYGAMSWPAPSPAPPQEPDDWEHYAKLELLRKNESRDPVAFDPGRYQLN